MMFEGVFKNYLFKVLVFAGSGFMYRTVDFFMSMRFFYAFRDRHRRSSFGCFRKLIKLKKEKGYLFFYGSCIPPLVVVPCIQVLSLMVPKTSTML